MRRYGILAAIGLATTGLAATAVTGQEAAKDPEIVRLERETALLIAQAARDNAAAAVTTARTACVQAKIGALGLPSAEGKTTLGTNGGMIEAWMLSASTVDAAGVWIAREIVGARANPGNFASMTATRSVTPPQEVGVQPNVPSRAVPPAPPTVDAGPLERVSRTDSTRRAADTSKPVLLVGGDEDIVLDTADDVSAQISSADMMLRDTTPSFCISGGQSAGRQAGGAFATAAIGALVGLLKTDTEISGIDVPVANRMLVAGVARRLVRAEVPVTIPSAAIAPVEDSSLAADWGKLLSSRDDARACRTRFAAQGKNAWIKKKTVALDQAVAAVDALEAKLTKPDENGRIPLARAVRVETLLRRDPQILRVTVEKGGGSLLKRSNLWTALGAPAVGITGGLIISYMLTDPRSGAFLQGGTLVCRTALTNLRDVQSGRVGGIRRAKAECSPLLAVDE